MAIKTSSLFKSRMRQIRSFLVALDAIQVYDRLLDELGHTIYPNLQAFPLLGKPYLESPVQSTEALMATARLPRDAHKLLRKYVHDDFVILYAVFPDAIHLISIRHHRETSFNP